MSAHAVTFSTFISGSSSAGPDWRPRRADSKRRFPFRFSHRAPEKSISVGSSTSVEEERAKRAARMYAATAT